MNILVDNTSPMFTFDDTTELLSSTLSEMGHNVKVNNGELCSYAKMEQNPNYVFTSLPVFDNDMAHYLANNITKTIFVINIESQNKVKDILEIEEFLHKYKVSYKFVVNNHRSRKIIFKYPKNVINFIYGASGYLLSDTTVDWKGRKIDCLMVANDQALDIKILADAQRETSIHALRTVPIGQDNASQAAFINMDKTLHEYKDILNNYNKILYYAPHLGRDFFELCKLRKPIYTVSCPTSIASKALKIEGLDITWENRKENKDINWNQIYDKVDNDFSFKRQVEKLMSHLPKVSK